SSLMSTSLMPISGCGTSASHRPGSDLLFTSAFMRSGPLRGGGSGRGWIVVGVRTAAAVRQRRFAGPEFDKNRFKMLRRSQMRPMLGDRFSLGARPLMSSVAACGTRLMLSNEVDRLRARVAELEAENAELRRRLAGRPADGGEHAEDALWESEANWRSLVDSIPDFLMLLDPDGTIRWLNRAAPGRRPEELVGINVLP